MDFHLDSLLQLPHVTVESCVQQPHEVCLKLRLLNEEACCSHCGKSSDELHQNRPIVIRDLAVFGRATYLQVPRRQFYCRDCQRYFTESLSFVEAGRHYTQRYETYVYQQVLNEELNKIRKQVGMFQRGSKFLLLKNGKDLSQEETQKLALILQRSKRLSKAYQWKEEFRAICEQPLTAEGGKQKIQQWTQQARSIYVDVITTIQTHLDGICNYFCHRTTNGVMEGMNNRIKLIKRHAYGFVNFANFRERLLACFSNKENLSLT